MLSLADIEIPSTWPLVCAADTGTYLSAIIATIEPEFSQILYLAEFPNYRYVGGELELLDLSNTEWAESVVEAYHRLRPNVSKVHAWCDPNTQFRREFQRYGLHLQGNPKKLELRVEITRQYVQSHDPQRFWLAPWLSVLPYEFEHAVWPDEATSAGKFERIKRNDHTLDCAEHIASRRPRTKMLRTELKESFLQRYVRENRRTDRAFNQHINADRHLGIHR